MLSAQHVTLNSYKQIGTPVDRAVAVFEGLYLLDFTPLDSPREQTLIGEIRSFPALSSPIRIGYRHAAGFSHGITFTSVRLPRPGSCIESLRVLLQEPPRHQWYTLPTDRFIWPLAGKTTRRVLKIYYKPHTGAKTNAPKASIVGSFLNNHSCYPYASVQVIIGSARHDPGSL